MDNITESQIQSLVSQFINNPAKARQKIENMNLTNAMINDPIVIGTKNPSEEKLAAKRTNMFVVASEHFPDAVETLIDLGANIEADDFNGNTAILKVSDKRALEALLDAGADFDRVNDAGENALFNATKNHPELAKSLLEVITDPDHKNENGDPAISFLHGDDNSEILKHFIDSDADLDITDSHGESVIFKMIKQRDKEAIQVLLDADVDLNLVNNNGQTPLSFAKTAFPKITSTLEEYGAEMPKINSVSTGEQDFGNKLNSWRGQTQKNENKGLKF